MGACRHHRWRALCQRFQGNQSRLHRKALGSYGERPIVLIAGGRNKGSDMAVLVPLMRAHCRGVVLVGEATGDFIDAFARTGYTAYVCADSFEDAVASARNGAVWRCGAAFACLRKLGYV